MVTTLVTDPAAYLRGKARERRLWREVVVVFVVGALGSLGHLYLVQLFIESVDTAGYTAFMAIGYVLEPILGLFAFWIGASILGHYLAGYFNGRGPIYRVLKLSAWAMVPIGIGNLVRSAAIYSAYRGIDPDTVAIDATGFDAQFAAFQELHMSDPVVLVATLALVITVVWSGYILSIAIRSAKQNLSEDDARIAAGVPAGLFVLYLLYSLTRALGVL